MIKMQSTAIDISKIWPVAYVDRDGTVLNRRGHFTVGFELEYPVAYSVDETEYDEMLMSYGAACHVLPAYTIIHRQDIYLYDRYEKMGSNGSFLSDCYEKHFDGRRRMNHHSYIFISTSSKSLTEKSAASSAIIRGYGDVKSVPSALAFEEWRSKCGEFIASFCASGRIKARPLTRRDWLGEGDEVGIVQRYLMMGDESPVMFNPKLQADAVLSPDKVVQCYDISESEQLPGEIDSTIKVDSLSSTTSEVRLSFASKLGMLLDCEHALNQYIVIPSQQDILKTLEDKRKRMTSGLSSSDNRINAEELQNYLDEQYRLALVTVKAACTLVTWGPDSDQLKIREKVSSALTTMGITAVANNRDCPVSWYAGCPSAAAEIGDSRLMTQALSATLPLCTYETYEKPMTGGILRFCDRMTHTPITIDCFEEAYRRGLISNMNAFVLGGSGAGKSFTINHLAQNCYAAGHHLYIIDVGDSYQGLCSLINEESGGRDGQYNSWSAEHPFTFNPFAQFGKTAEKDDEEEMDSDMNFILSFLKTAYDPEGGWTTTRANILSTMVTRFYDWFKENKPDETPIFDDFYKFVDEKVGKQIGFVSVYAKEPAEESIEETRNRLELKAIDEQKNGYFVGSARITPEDFNIKEFIVSLQPYSLEGRFGFLLNDRNPKDLFTSRFVVFEVDALQQVDDGTKDKKFYSLCILCIMNAFDKKMREDKTAFKHLIVEEAWQAISNETMSPFLRSLWKTARKFNTSAMVVTQEINDILSNEIIKETIIKNSAVKILLDQSNNKTHFGQVATYLGLTQKACNLIFSINKEPNPYSPKSREVFIMLEDKHTGVYSTEVSPAEAIAFESAKDKKEPYLRRAKELGSYKAAILEAINRLTA